MNNKAEALRDKIAVSVCDGGRYLSYEDAADRILTLCAEVAREAVPNMERYDTGGMLNEKEVIAGIDKAFGVSDEK